MAKMLMIIGVPRSGKSTFVKKLERETGYSVLSADALRIEINGTKNPVKETEKKVWSYFNNRLDYLLEQNKSFIVDNTNVSKKARKKILQKSLKAKYKNEAFVLTTNLDEIKRRAKLTNFPLFVINRMINNFQMPEKEEGFSLIHIVEG